MMPRPLVLAGLILLAALSRLVPHPPNFAPITAMAVFGAIRYADRRAAVLTPLLALLLSDLVREALYRYGLVPEWGLYRGMWAVYGITALIALVGRSARDTRSPAAIAGITLAGSCLFFVISNFAVWAGGSTYPHTTEGLIACYTAAIPFFRNAFLGDAFYATVLFGGWALAESRLPALRPAPVTTNL
ncbi:MAG: hypothetical protein JWO38_4992 [Gemmataceae bacterium]|nr:hypothetical protein [Gemmataceae bacterium]